MALFTDSNRKQNVKFSFYLLVFHGTYLAATSVLTQSARKHTYALNTYIFKHIHMYINDVFHIYIFIDLLHLQIPEFT